VPQIVADSIPRMKYYAAPSPTPFLWLGFAAPAPAPAPAKLWALGLLPSGSDSAKLIFILTLLSLLFKFPLKVSSAAIKNLLHFLLFLHLLVSGPAQEYIWKRLFTFITVPIC
jgi:hypothetical protein